MTRRTTSRLVMGVAATATAACTALVSLPAYALLSHSAAPAAAGAGAVDSGPVLQPSLVRHLDTVSATEPVRVLVQAGGSIVAAERAVRTAGMVTELSLSKVGMVAAIGTRAQVRALAAAGATRVDWADEQLELAVTSNHRATRAEPVHDGKLDVDGSGTGEPHVGEGFSVAVIDSGVDGTHPAFQQDGESRVRRNVKVLCSDAVAILDPELAQTLDSCVVDATGVNDTDTPSAGGHGTHVAGIAAGARVTDSTGRKIRGSAPGADLISVSTGASLSVYGGTLGMYWVLQHHEDPCAGQRVPIFPTTCNPIIAVNNSWGPVGGGTFSATAPQVIVQRALVEEGVSVVWAAGNDGGDGTATATNPYSVDPTPGILSVANYDDGGTANRDNVLDSSSSRGKKGDVSTYPDLSAPGANITAACRPYLSVCATGLDTADPNYNTISGTSMAAPHIAGYIAVLQGIAVRKTGSVLTPAQIEDLLVDTAHQFGADRTYETDTRNPDSTTTTSFDAGHGLVDLSAAASRLTGSPITVVDETSCPVDARFTDPRGDASGVLGVPTVPQGNVPELDLLQAWFTSTKAGDALTFHVEVDDLPATPGGASGEGEYLDLNFTIGAAGYYLGATRTSAGEEFLLGDFGGTNGTRRTLVPVLEGDFDPATDVITVTLKASDVASVPALAGAVRTGAVVGGFDFVSRRQLVLLVPDADNATGGCAYTIGAEHQTDPTVTATPTVTTSPTGTATATSTPTGTATTSAAPTATQTVTATATTTATTTATATATATATQTVAGPTATATTTATQTATATTTATATQTVAGPTATATQTVAGPGSTTTATTTATATATTTATTTATATATATETVTETASPGNQAPVVTDVSVVPADGRKANAQERVLFSALAEDGDGDELTYSWSFSDGTVEEGAEVAHRFARKGVYRVVLTVTDGTDTTRLRLLVDVKKGQKRKG